MSNNSTVYELAYHLSADLSEADLSAQVSTIKDLVTSNGGEVKQEVEPKRKRLSYPIDHKQYTHFGVMTFTLPGEALAKLEAAFKLDNNIVRTMIVRLPETKELRVLGDVAPRAPKPAPTPAAPAQEPAVPKPEPTAEEKAKMSKDIEDVLENL